MVGLIGWSTDQIKGSVAVSEFPTDFQMINRTLLLLYAHTLAGSMVMVICFMNTLPW